MPTLISLTPSPQTAVALSLLRDATAYYFSAQTEPDDHARFVRDVAAKCQTPLIEDPDGRDIFTVFRDEGRFFLGNDDPICSRRLKLDRLMEHARMLAPCTVAFANTSATYQQAQRLYALFSIIPGVTVTFPLIEHRYSADDCRKIVVEQWGMTLPAMTTWLGDAVCLPCIRGTLAYYGELWQRSPDALSKLMEVEAFLGQSILDDGTLEELFPRCLHAANVRREAFSTVPLLWLPCACK